MSKRKRNNKSKKVIEDANNYSAYFLVPIILISSLLPLIVKIKVINLDDSLAQYWTGGKTSIDFFSYYKSKAFITFSILSIIVYYFAKRIKKLEFKKSIINYFIALYSLMIVLSTMFSNNKDVALFGFIERYEGMFVLLGYMIVLFIAFNIVNDESDIKIIIRYILISSIIISIIGLFQFFKKDVYNTEFMRLFTMTAKQRLKFKKINFSLGKNIVFSTLYHYNYVGSYMAMILPLFLTLTLFSKNKIEKIIYGIVSILNLIILITCQSRAGMVGLVISFIVFLIIMRKYIFKYWKISLICLISFVFIFISVNKFSNGSITLRAKLLLNDIKGVSNTSEDYIKDIKINGNELDIITLNRDLKVTNGFGTLAFKDGDKLLEPTVNNDFIEIKDDKFNDFKFKFGVNKGNNVLQVVRKGTILNFAMTDLGFRMYDDKGQIINEIKYADKFGFEGKERIGSARGYIWSRCIPLLKNTVFLGYGPDTFAINFPQYDYIGKLAAYDTIGMLVDKPHNLYLQIALSTGMISLIAVLAMFIYYISVSFKLYFRNDFKSTYSKYGLAIFLGIIGYLGAAFFNDSIVSVAPVFWVLLGMGISVNMKYGR